jgi:hypothetical protein
MSRQGIRDRAREFFTLDEMERAARALPDEQRAEVSRAIEFASQKREAAETLWPRGSAAEALKLLYSSLDELDAALGALASRTSAEGPPWLARSLATLAETQKRSEAIKRPELEGDVQPGHEAAFQAMVDALSSVVEGIGPRVASPAQMAVLRRRRRAGGALAAVVVVASLTGALAFALHTPAFSHAEATAAESVLVAEHAIDGDTNTWWVLPSDKPGRIDLTLGKPRAVPRLRIVGGNPPWNDHLTRDARIEAVRDGEVVKSLDVTFRVPPSAEPDWTEIPLGAPKCDHIRITLLSPLRGTAAIAEVQLQ